MLGGFVGERQLESVADLEQIRLAELLLLVGGHARLGRFTQAVALHSLGQDHGGLAGVPRRTMVGVENLERVKPAAPQRPDLVVAHVLD